MFPNLKAIVFNETDKKCGNAKLETRCPELNNMLTTVRFGNFFAAFPAGRCEQQPPPCVALPRVFTVPFVGQSVGIGANIPSPTPVGWKPETPHIVGGPRNL